jgi:hypothetical protein
MPTKGPPTNSLRPLGNAGDDKGHGWEEGTCSVAQAGNGGPCIFDGSVAWLCAVLWLIRVLTAAVLLNGIGTGTMSGAGAVDAVAGTGLTSGLAPCAALAVQGPGLTTLRSTGLRAEGSGLRVLDAIANEPGVNSGDAGGAPTGNIPKRADAKLL